MVDIDVEGRRALQEYFASCSVVINSATPGFEHGTGVTVSYNNETYILTAAHVLKKEPRDEKLLIIEKPNSPLKEVHKHELRDAFFAGTHGRVTGSTSTRITIAKRLVNEKLGDIAALKIAKASNNQLRSTLFDLSSQGAADISEGTSAVIFGFPGEIALHAQHKVTGQRGVAVFPYAALQNIMAFPSSLTDVDNPTDPKIDFFTDFDQDDDSCDPRGMSGGGAWAIPKVKEGELWSPSQTKLLGIQSGLYRERKLLRLVRIERVMDLLSSG